MKKKTRRTKRARTTTSIKKALRSQMETKYYYSIGAWNAGVFTVPQNAKNIWEFRSLLASFGGTPNNGFVVGSSNGQRIGNKVFIKSIYATVYMQSASGMDTNGSLGRIVVYMTKLPNGATPNTLEVFNNDSVKTPRNATFLKKYTLLKDLVHSVVPTSSTTSGPSFLYTLKIPVNKTLVFKDSSTDIGGLVNFDIGIGFCASENNCCALNVECVTAYTDA